MDYATFLANSRRVLSIIDEKIDGKGFDPNNRNKLSAALFDIAHEHAKAVIILLEEKLYAPAYALARSLQESFVRAAWIQHCASDNDIAKVIKQDSFPLKYGQMLSAVEEKRQWENTLTQLKKSAWKTMNSYTHGGIQLISRRIKGEYIEHNFDELETIALLQLVCLIAFLSLNEMIGMSIGYDVENIDLKNILEDLCQWCFIDLSKK